MNPITNKFLKRWEQAGGKLAKIARELRNESEEDLYECEHCNAVFPKSEILYREYGSEIRTIAFCPRCKEATKLICVTEVSE